LDNRQHRFLASSDDSEALDAMVDDDAKSEETDRRGSERKEVTAAMVASIGFYKKFISPLLPPACRFLPTCSQYGVQAIEQFGPTKGAILTAWRLLRCSPIGGRGYDPPKWPPVAYNFGSY
jgi:putative membrane protein insertion efficiency factor